jgi:predicted PurR-regulated permease PerM
MTGESGETRRRILRLAKTILTLSFLLVFLNLLHPELSSLINYFLQGFAITSQTVLNIITLILIVYFGYFILIDTKYFLDMLSTRLGAKERNKSKIITYDVAGIISLILASQLVTPLLTSISQFGDTLAKAVNIVFLAISLFLAYHLASQIYYLAKQNVEKLLEDARHIRQERREKTVKGEKE